jgi:RNA polymerase sigma factor (sigma-70 family)
MEKIPEVSSDIIPLHNGGPAQNFGLSIDDFKHMLAQLREGADQLFEHIFMSHFDDCRRFIASKYAIDLDVSYDITMDTMLEFRLKLIQDKITYGNLRYLFTRMASNNYLSKIGAEKRLKQILISEEVDEIYHEERFDKLGMAWENLEEAEKKILTQFYYEDRSLKEIADTAQLNDAAVRKKKQRAMDTLRLAFFKIYQH